ncbi:MAG: hypothetical protein ABSB26_08960 [Nitrososphaerales archaeon]|jgi:hypothetical protein
MCYESLALDVQLSLAGLKIIKPPLILGKSGVNNRFSLVGKKDSHFFGFEIYREPGTIDVLRTYIKAFDTGATAFVVCVKGNPGGEVRRLASSYGIRIIGPGEFEGLLSEMRAPQVSGRTRLLQ